MRFYHIAPLAKLPLTKEQFFTYSSSRALALGDLVEIYLGRRKIKGVVLKECTAPTFYTKPAKLLEKSALTENQIILAEKMSRHYLCSLGVVLKLFLLGKSKKITAPKTDFAKRKIAKYSLTKAQRNALTKISETKHPQVLLFGAASSGKTEVLTELAHQALKQDKQFLLLLPEIFLGYHELERYLQKFIFNNQLATPSQIGFYHSNLTGSEKTYLQRKIKSGQIKIIIATRAGLFLPFKDLAFIAIDEEQSETFKSWSGAPYYEAKSVAQMLSQIFKAKLILSSATPSLSTYLEKKQLKIKLPPLEIADLSPQKPTVRIKNVFEEKYIKNFQFKLSKELKEKLLETKDNKEIAFFFVGRRGKSSSVVCQNCRKKLTCPTCQAPLNYVGDFYRCFNCSFKTDALIKKCPHCGSFRLLNFGFGTEAVADEIKTALPKLRVATVDREKFAQKRARTSLFKKIRTGKVDVIVGTYAIAKGFDLANLSLAVVPNADDFAANNNFLFDQQYLGNLFQLAGRLNRPTSKQTGLALIYTKKPQGELFQLLEKYDWQRFLLEEKANRQALHLPPFGKAIKLICKAKTEKNVEKETKKVYDKLSLAVKKNDLSKIQLNRGKVLRRGNFYQQNILLKLPTNRLPKELKTSFLGLKTDWQIDLSPIDF